MFSGEARGRRGGEGENAMEDGKLDSGLHRLYESFNVVTVSSTAETLDDFGIPAVGQRKKRQLSFCTRVEPSHWSAYPVAAISLKAAKSGKIKNKKSKRKRNSRIIHLASHQPSSANCNWPSLAVNNDSELKAAVRGRDSSL